MRDGRNEQIARGGAQVWPSSAQENCRFGPKTPLERRAICDNFAVMKQLFQHAAMTEGLTVRVAVNFHPEQSRVESGKWFWVYHIRIENDSAEAVRLLTRHWRITDGRGVVNFVDGEGVVGEHPYLTPGDSFRYTSAAMIETPVGVMQGKYEMLSDNGESFKAPIPKFILSIPRTLH